MHTGCASLISLAWEIASRISLGPEIFQHKQEEYRGSNSVGHVLMYISQQGQTPEGDNDELRVLLDGAGALTASSTSIPIVTFSYTLYLRLPVICERAKLLLLGNQVMKRITDEKRNTLLVVAALLVTVTYQAAITPPGGLWQDDLFGPNATDTFSHREYYQLKLNTTAAHIAGSAIATASELFLFFFFFNSLIFVLSNVIMVVLVPPFEIIGLLLSGVCLILCLCYLSSLLLIFQAPDWTAFIVLFSPIIALMVPLAAALFSNALPFARKGIRALRNLIWND